MDVRHRGYLTERGGHNQKEKQNHSRMHKNTSFPDIGPGKYEEYRTSFPRIDKVGALLPSEKRKCIPQYVFKSHSPRIARQILSDAPLPGAYNYKSLADEVKAKRHVSPINIIEKIKKKEDATLPGPGFYKVIQAYNYIDNSPYKNSRMNSIFVSKTERKLISCMHITSIQQSTCRLI